MNIKKTMLAAAVTSALALGAAGQANASVYAGSALDVQNLTVTLSPLSGASVTTFEFTATNTATLNGASSPVQSATCGGTIGSNTCNPATPVLDPLAANAPGSNPIRANNNFAHFGPSANTYSNSDSVINTAELVTGTPSSTRQIAESEIQSTGTARSNAEITSNTGFVFSFTLAAPGTLSLNFSADPYLRAYIDQILFSSGSAQANLTASFSLTANDGSGSVTWSPQGTATNDCNVDGLVGVTCTETADSQDLNRNVAVSSNPADIAYSAASLFTAFGIDITGLLAGDYTLAFNALTSTSVRTALAVPEPGVLALLGIAFAGMGFAGRRRKGMLSA